MPRRRRHNAWLAKLQRRGQIEQQHEAYSRESMRKGNLFFDRSAAVLRTVAVARVRMASSARQPAVVIPFDVILEGAP